MLIIIDAYNFLKQKYWPNINITEKQRENFINTIKKYAKIKKHNIHIIFDGGDFPWPQTEKKERTKITYSGKSSADDIIKNFIEKSKPQNALLVTYDRDLKIFAHKYNVIIIDPIEFDYFLNLALTKKIESPIINKPLRQTTPQNKEIDALMQEASQQIIKPKESDLIQDKSILKPKHQKKQSKSNKKIIEIIKKL